MEKAKDVIEKLKTMKLKQASLFIEDTITETLTYYSYPSEHWRKIRTNNPLERIMREIRRRTRVVGAFPDRQSALMLSAARLRHIANTRWGVKKYRQYEVAESKYIGQCRGSCIKRVLTEWRNKKAKKY